MRSQVSKLFENPVQTVSDRIGQILFSDFQNKLKAKQIFQKLNAQTAPLYTDSLQINAYQGTNSCVGAIQNYLNSKSHPAIAAALIQGSIATGEEVAYSDFDGIIVLDERRLENPFSVQSLLAILEKTSHMMLHQDSLQHHGWNILTLNELGKYPDDELPLVLLQHAKVIYPERSITLYYTLDTATNDYKNSLYSLCNSLKNKAVSNSPYRSFYHFKIWVSQILLLPSVYLQAKNRKPVFKKESFEMMQELPANTSTIIEKYTSLRLNWSQAEAGLPKEIRFRKWKHAGKLADPLTTPLPNRYKIWLTEENRTEIIRLTDALLDSIR